MKMRSDLGESQAEFGARFGVDQSTIHRWETNGLPPKGAARMAIEMVMQTLAQSRAVLRGGGRVVGA